MTPRAGERGQAVQIGAVVLFAFLVLALTGYQAAVVPQQNARVEFQHNAQVGTDVQELRSDVVEAAATGERRSQVIALGTSYPPRAVALNPAPPSGSLRTVTYGTGTYGLTAGGADLERICGYSQDGDGAVESRAITYRASYNEFRDAPTMVFENSVAYRRFDGDVLVDSNQTLVDGTVITLTPLRGDLSATGSGTKTVDVVPGKAGVGRTNLTDVVVSVPSNLSATVWRSLLADEMTPNGNVENVTESGNGNVEIGLRADEYTVVCPVVGLGSAPSTDPAETLGRSGGGGDDTSDLNPGGAGEVHLDATERDGNVVVLTFDNPGREVNLSTVRFNFYASGNKDAPNQVDVINESDGTVLVDDLGIRGETRTPSSVQTFSGGGGTTRIALRFEDSTGSVYDTSQEDFAVLRLGFSDGQDSLYFVDMPENKGGGNNGNNGNNGNGGA